MRVTEVREKNRLRVYRPLQIEENRISHIESKKNHVYLGRTYTFVIH